MSRLKDLEASISNALPTGGVQPHGAGRPRRPGSIPAPASLLAFSGEMAEANAKIGKPKRVRIDLCDDGDFHATSIDQNRVDELIPNIRANGQAVSAQVRVKGDRYEILSGRHRKYALLALGEQEWDIVIKEASDDDAERLSFYDNLMAPNLTDYARFKGFERRRQSKGMTIEQLAEESGISKSTIGRLLMFSVMPQGSEEYIQRRPDLFGATLINQLSPLVKAHSERVLKAIQMIAGGNLAGKDAVKWITQPPSPARAEVKRTVIKSGRDGFARIAVQGAKITLSLNHLDDVDALETEIAELVRKYAQAKSTSK